MIDGSIDGPDLDRLERDLRDLDDRVEAEAARRLDRAASKLKGDVDRSAVDKLPRHGGLGRQVATRAKLAVDRRAGGVTVRAEGMPQLAGIDAGQVMHPVYRNRDVWVVQQITPAWFSDPMEAGRHDLEEAVDDALDEVAHDVARRA